MTRLDRPIFIVGHARGGSTLLGGLINWHSHVGPRHEALLQAADCNMFLRDMFEFRKHLRLSESLEQKEVWFDTFPGRDVFLHMGKELIAERVPQGVDRAALQARLTTAFREQRFLSKAPTNSFRVKAIRELFPDARMVAICRRGGPVIASWGQRHYGFGRPVHWGALQIDRMGYLRGITVFARKWRETLFYLEKMRRAGELTLYSYNELTAAPQATLQRIFHDVELPEEPYVRDVRVRPSGAQWRRQIPRRYWLYVRLMTMTGNLLIGRLEAANGILDAS